MYGQAYYRRLRASGSSVFVAGPDDSDVNIAERRLQNVGTCESGCRFVFMLVLLLEALGLEDSRVQTQSKQQRPEVRRARQRS